MENFSKFAENGAYTWTAGCFGRLPPEQIGGTKTEPVLVDTGAFLQENGDTLFRLYYPEAKTVKISIGYQRSAVLELQKNEQGCFEGIYPYPEDIDHRGARDLTIRVDGSQVLSPRIPISFGDAPKNYIYIPSPEWEDYLIKQVPHGSVSYELFWSEVFQDWRRCLVYTPYEYRHRPDKQYPVIYLHHGGNGNETQWTFSGKAPLILDNLIAEGKAEPCILVSNYNSPIFSSDAAKRVEEYRMGMEQFCQMLIRDCIPFIEKEYRAIPDKWHRATAGLSYGCMVTSYTGFGHPEVFGNVGLISGGLRCKDFAPVLKDNHHLDWMLGNASGVGEQYRLIYRSHGTNEYHDSTHHVEDDAWLKEQGISQLPCFVREWFPGGLHQWDTFGKGLAGFVKNVFQ